MTNYLNKLSVGKANSPSTPKTSPSSANVMSGWQSLWACPELQGRAMSIWNNRLYVQIPAFSMWVPIPLVIGQRTGVETDWEDRSIRKFLGPVHKKTWRTINIQADQERWNLIVMGESHTQFDHGCMPRPELKNSPLFQEILWLKSDQFRVSNSTYITLPVP
jgi:hypothetical protein